MGLRFRKSIKIAPGVKVNLNKKSTSVTFGGKGVHHTVSSTGRKTTSVGIPVFFPGFERPVIAHTALASGIGSP